MRVISGRAKGRKLKSVPGDTTRPVLDRVKESLFNIMGPEIAGSRWLDLFAGTGQVGIEALSRGASHVVFVDSVVAAVRTIGENLEHTRLAAQAEVRKADAFDYLRRPPSRPFDAIYVAPPQYLGLWRTAVEALDGDAGASWLAPQGSIIVQIDRKEFEELELTTLELYDQRTYGATMLCFYGRLDADAGSDGSGSDDIDP